MTGSRDWTDWKTLTAALFQAADCYDPITVVSGACPTGADAMAEWVAEHLLPFLENGGVRVERHPADWDRHGKAAGPVRNQEMVDLGADLCLAFPLGASRGTRDCMRRAEAAGIPVRVIEP